MSEPASRLRTLIVPALVIAATALLLVTLLPGSATAQVTTPLCDDDRPLFITDVHITPVPGATDGHITDENAAFLEAGDRVQFQLDITNKLPPACNSDGDATDWTDDLTLQIQYLDSGWVTITADGDCGTIAPDESCSTGTFDLPGDRFVEPPTGSEDEQPVRFLVHNGQDALAGAERVLVVDHLPDMEPTAINLEDANEETDDIEGEDELTTTYDPTTTLYNVTIENNGNYPNWNPNGGSFYWDASGYHNSASSPSQSESDAADVDFRCDDWANDHDDVDPSDALCSFRQGAVLDTPIYWQLTPDGEPGTILESDVAMTGLGSAPNVPQTRENAVEGNDQVDASFSAFDRQSRAGDYDLSVELDHDPNVAQNTWIPDDDPDNNELTTDVEVLGADMTLSDIGLQITGFDGLCTSPEDPCEPDDHQIEIDPRFENQGEHGESDREWNASISMQVGSGDEEIVLDTAQSPPEPFRTTFSQVPEAGGDDQSIFDSPITVEPNNHGGKHILFIRIDHPSLSYGEDPPFSVSDSFGRIAEVNEGLDCPDGYDDPSTFNDDATKDGSLAPPLDSGVVNTYCVELFFTAPEGPSILDPVIEIDGEENDPFEEAPTVFEGDTATFRATVEAHAGLDRVNATFTSPEDAEGDQTVTELPMEQNTSQENVWEVEHSFEGDLGEYAYTVTAWDTLNQSESGEPAPFIVDEWPKNITTSIGVDRLNGETSVLGPDAPEYQGTVNEPDNWFNLTVNVTETGHDVQPGDVHLRVWDPDGNQRVDKTRMAPITACYNQTTGQHTWGDNCDDENFDGPFSDDKGAEWTSWYVDTRDDETWNHPNMTLPWVGEFNVEVIVKDGFGRTNHANWTAQLQDVGPAELTNATLTPTTLVPGDEIHASGEASDPLRVERVYLNVIKPSGDTAEGNLTITEVHDAETQSGIWEATFTAGQAESLFDQAGTYEVEMIADDFGTNPNSTDLGTLTIDPGDPPEILSLFTDPSEEAEAGINLTWSADIAATTAIQPPQLTVTKGDGSTETLTLTEDEDTGLWTATIQPEPLQPEETWTYELEVRDFADQVDTATGEILVLQNTAPHATNWQPNVQTDDGRPWVNDTPTLSVDLVDANGINESSIHVRIDGATIWEDGSGDAQVEEIPQTCPGCYRITHTVSGPLSDGDTLTLEIKASEESDEELESDWHTRQFHVDATDPSADVNLAPSLTVDESTVIGLSTQIEASVDDAQSGPGDLRITVESLAGSTAATRQVETVEGEHAFQLNEFEDAFRGHGEYRIEVEPWDGVGNKGDTHQLRLLYDAAPPQIRIEPQLDQPASFVAVNITDVSEVLEVQVVFTPDGQPEESLGLERDGDLWVGEIVDPETGDPYPEDTEIEYRIEASDYWGNSGATDARTFIAGATPPTLTIDSPEDGATVQGTIDVLWTATDEDVPDEDLNVSLWYSLPDGDPREIPGATDLANTGQFELDTALLPNGRLELQAIAFDGATFGSDSITLTVRNLGDVFEGPELVDADTRDDRVFIQPGQETDFQVRINENVLQAWANVTKDGETVASYELQDDGDGVWSASFTAPEEEGDYDMDLAAMTQDGPIHADNAYGFSVQSDDKSFLPEWTILTVLFAGAVAVGAFGLTRRWG